MRLRLRWEDLGEERGDCNNQEVGQLLGTSIRKETKNEMEESSWKTYVQGIQHCKQHITEEW